MPADIAGELNLPFCINAFLEHYLSKLEARLLDKEAENSENNVVAAHNKLWYQKEPHEVIKTNNSLLDTSNLGLKNGGTPISKENKSVNSLDYEEP